MLLKSILSYMPANLTPALVAVGTIVAFTRLLPPDAFGHYALAQAVILFGQATAFYALGVSITRFYEGARSRGELGRLLANAYACFAGLAALATVVFVSFVLLLAPGPGLAAALWLALPTLLLRGLVYVNLAIHRGAGRTGRYNAIEVGQGLIAFAVALVLVWGLGFEASGLILGLLVGALVVLIYDAATFWQGIGRPDRVGLKDLWQFGGPLVGAHALSAIAVYADRFFVERLLSAFSVGLYAAAYAIVDRAVSLIFMAVTLGAYPLVVGRLEREGKAAAQRQLAENGTALMALGLPAAVGLAMAAPQIAAVLVGEAYRTHVVALMPWIAVLAFMRGLQAHFFDQTLHLARRTDLFVVTLGPSVLLTIILNPLLLPVMGLYGTLCAALIAQTVTLLVTIVVGGRAFGIVFPWGEASRILLAVGLMALALRWIPFATTLSGLGGVIVCGVVVYVTAALMLDVAGSRCWLRANLALVPVAMKGARR